MGNMKIFIQRLSDSRFLKDTGQWNVHPEVASEFMTAVEALHHVSEHNLKNVQIVLRFPNQQDEVKIVVGAKPRVLTHQFPAVRNHGQFRPSGKV